MYCIAPYTKDFGTFVYFYQCNANICILRHNFNAFLNILFCIIKAVCYCYVCYFSHTWARRTPDILTTPKYNILTLQQIPSSNKSDPANKTNQTYPALSNLFLTVPKIISPLPQIKSSNKFDPASTTNQTLPPPSNPQLYPIFHPRRSS